MVLMDPIESGMNFYQEKDGRDIIHNYECFMNLLQPLKIFIYVIYHSFYKNINHYTLKN